MKSKVIYEVLRVIDGKPLFLKEHFERMENSFKLINKKIPLSYELIHSKINSLIKSKNDKDGNIKMTYDIDVNEFKVFYIEHFYPTEQMYKDGVKVIFYFGERENPNAKIVNNEFRSKVTKEIELNNSYEAILVDRNGNITEGSKSNIFMIKDGVLITSPVDAVLPGVTRNKIIEAAKLLNIQVKEEEYSYLNVDKLDAMFISGTSPKVLPIKCVGDIKFNVNNFVLKSLMDGYDELVKKDLKKY